MRASKALIAGILLLAAPVLAQPFPVPPPPPYEPAPQGPVPEDNAGSPPLVHGGYVALRGSMAMNGNHDTTYTPTAAPTAIRASYATGGGGSLALGAYLPLNLRMELEALYRWQPVSHVSVNGLSTAANGQTQVMSPFLNLFWDMPMPDDIGINPFVGLGVGAAYSQTDDYTATNYYLHQNRWDLAYSFMGGFAMPLDQTSRLSLMYRYMQIRDSGHKCAATGTLLSTCYDNNIDSQSVDLGYEVDL